MLSAMLVAAGFGTRLAPLTNELPKPAVPVANRPLAAFALRHLHRAGVRSFTVNTHHLAERLRAALAPCVPGDSRLCFSDETEILGTGGGIRRAWALAGDGPLLVMNAKLLFQPQIDRLVRTHAATGAVATMVLRSMPCGTPFGPVDVDPRGEVRAILADGPAPPGQRRLMFTGVHLLGPAVRQRLPTRGCVIRDGYMRWLAEGLRIAYVLDASPWADLGVTPRHYGEGQLALLDGRWRYPEVVPDGDRCVVAQDAQLAAGCRLWRTSVGQGARIDANVQLDDCIVWSGAHVREGASRTIITSTGARVAF